MAHDPRLFTLEEAEATLEQVRPAIEEAQVQARKVRELDEQLRDMITVYGREVSESDHENHDEFQRFLDRRLQHVSILQVAITELARHGVEMKDPEIGLIDFHAQSGDELVCLCWHLGEDRIRFWHTLRAGFAGRQPIPGVDLLEP